VECRIIATASLYASGMKPQLKADVGQQLSGAVQQYQFFTGLYVQSIGFLIAADAVLVGYSLNSRASGPILLATLMPPIMLLLRIGFGREALVAAYVAIQLEHRLDINVDCLISTQVATRYPGAYHRLLEILKIESQGERMTAIRNNIKPRHIVRKSDVILFLSGTLVQAGLFWFALIRQL
jgi:hypothetical protein